MQKKGFYSRKELWSIAVKVLKCLKDKFESFTTAVAKISRNKIFQQKRGGHKKKSFKNFDITKSE